LNALYDGSNSHNHARVLIAGGITHGTSSIPATCVAVCRGCLNEMRDNEADQRLEHDAVMAKMHGLLTYEPEGLRLNRNSKLPKPMKRCIACSALPNAGNRTPDR